MFDNAWSKPRDGRSKRPIFENGDFWVRKIGLSEIELGKSSEENASAPDWLPDVF